ncbi:MAG: type II toxin-antitoxin system VapC family toxin [Alphaproteobacteria bacterium]|nr:type II toxin-antitoxin system VapC family toxin [Alphaproteobacteria bacterium]
MCKRWVDAVVAGDAQFGVSPLALSAVVRITTSPRIFKQPDAIGDVLSYCDNLLGQPHCEIVQPGERHWGIFARLCVETGTRGPRATDALFAALAIEHGCTWITYDRDYARFPGLSWQEPSA